MSLTDSADEPVPATGSTALVLNRTLARVHHLERWFSRLWKESSEREDAEPLHEILQTVHVWFVEVQREIVDHARGLPPTLSDEEASDLEGVYVKWLEVLENTVSGMVPLIGRPHGVDFAPIVVPLRRLASQIIPGASLIFQATEEWTYARSSRLAQLLERNTDAVLNNADLARMIGGLTHISVVSYPVVNESDVFQQLMIGHELGHLALRKRVDGGATAGDALFASAVRETPHPAGVDIDAAQRRANAWFTELACDLIALEVVGPSYMLTLWEFARPHNVWIYPREWTFFARYPSLARRISTLSNRLQHFLPPVGTQSHEVWEPLRKVFDDVGNSPPSEPPLSGEEDVYVDALVKPALDQLIASLGQLVGQARYKRPKFQRDAPIVWAKLDANIAPAERVLHRSSPVVSPQGWNRGERWSIPIDWRSIVNVAYVHWLSKHPSDSAPVYRERAVQAEEDRQEFSRHVYGTVELSELQRRMQALQLELRNLDEPKLVN